MISYFVAALLCSVAVPAGAGAAEPAISDVSDRRALTALKAADVRLHTIHYRLARANAPLCATNVASIGVVLHARSAYLGRYERAAVDLFGFRAPIAVEAVIAGGTAQAAGVRANESIIAIGGGDARSLPSTAAALNAIEHDGSDGTVTLGLASDSGTRTLKIAVERVCPERIEVQISSADNAGTDGRTIQVTSELMNRIAADDQLAAVVAHEFAHAVLMHPTRLSQADVARGLLSGFGRSRRLFRQTEEEADRLSVYLLANAGFDPLAAGRFWRNAGRRVGGGLFGIGTHMNWRDRAALVEAEAASIAVDVELPIIPPLVATRDRPLD